MSGTVKSFTLVEIVGPPLASQPVPADQTTDVCRDAVLGSKPGQFAKTHDVYFGTVFDDVNNASRTSPMGLLARQEGAVADLDPI